MPLKLTTYYRGSKVLTCQAPTPSIPQSCSESTRQLRGIPPYSLWHPKMTSPLRNCLPPYVKVSACFHPASSKDVRCTVRENISITRQTKRLSSVTCCKGLPMSIARFFSHRVPQPGKCHVRIQIFPGQPIHRHQLAAGAQLAAQRRKGGRAFQPVTYPANKERAQKTAPKCGKHVPKRRFSVLPDVAPRIFFQDTAPLPPASSSFSISKTS